VIATGMRPRYFGHDEFARLRQASRAQRRLKRSAPDLSAFELAESTDDEKERARK